MKNIGWIAGCLLVVVASVFGYGHWSDRQLAAKRDVVMEEWIAQRDRLSELLTEFKDATDLAASVPLSQVPQFIEKLQQLNRVVAKTPWPPCYQSWEKLNATDEVIATYLSHMKDPSDLSWFLRTRNEATLKLGHANSALARECSTSNIVQRAFEEVR